MTDIRKRLTRRYRLPLVLCCCFLLSGGAIALADEEEKPAKTLGSKQPATTEKPKAKAKPNSLSSFAAGIKLQSKEDGDQKVTISNRTLSSTSGGGTLSTGGGVTTGEEAKAKTESGGSASGAVPVGRTSAQNDYAQQKAKVEAMEKSLADFEAEVAKKDPFFTNTTQHRSPGTRAPDDLTREKANQELAEEQKKLDAMRKKAEKDGVELEKSK